MHCSWSRRAPAVPVRLNFGSARRAALPFSHRSCHTCDRLRSGRPLDPAATPPRWHHKATAPFDGVVLSGGRRASAVRCAIPVGTDFLLPPGLSSDDHQASVGCGARLSSRMSPDVTWLRHGSRPKTSPAAKRHHPAYVSSVSGRERAGGGDMSR
eukprot:358547-Chlamydomonas_euryale.AAC.4